MLSPAIARTLRSRGYDVEAVKEHPEWQGLPDDELIKVARLAGRAIVTINLRDFRPLHAALAAPGGAGHPGLVFVPTSYRLARGDIGALVGALEAKLAEFPAT